MGVDDRQRKRLFDMEFDEISVVDNGANQHAAIVFAKAHDPEEDQMPDLDLEDGLDEVEVYDENGDLVENFEHGDVVYDEEGNEYVFIEDGMEGDFEYEDEEVGKANPFQQAKLGFQAQKKFTGLGFQGPLKMHNQSAATRFGGHVARHQKKYAYGVPAGAAVGAGGLYAVNKSLGDVVLEELSKAANEDERSEIIAKAMEEVEFAKEQANEAWERVAEQEDAMLENAFISKAAEYNLPVDPEEFGPILKAASTVLDYDQLDLLDRLLSGVGEALYEEIGYVGDTDNASVLDAVDGYVNELVGKSDYTAEELSTAVFEANPQAYDEYLAENRW